MVIPQAHVAGRHCTVKIGRHLKMVHEINGRPITFIVEQVSNGRHACSVDDIRYLLSHIPVADWAGIGIILLRQPTRKERMLAPVWGRMFYHAELAFTRSRVRFDCPTVILEACEPDTVFKWSTSLDRDYADELERLRGDGHDIERTSRHYIISTNMHAVRATQLYRTLLHELGHWNDWLQKVEIPAERDEEDYGDLADRYFSRTDAERESYAHRYADKWQKTLRDKGIIPFEKM